MRKPFVAGNWKMNTDSRSSVELAQGVAKGASGLAGDKVNVAVIPPFVYLQSVVKAVSSTGVSVGSQDVYIEPKGAFTGEVSAAMLKDVGCTYVLCGHSERRHVLGESDELVGKKVTASIAGGLLPILCVGELLAERDAGQTEAVVARHLKTGLAGLSIDKMSAVTIAYEPVWAIGTGRTATPEQAQEVHVFVRKVLAEMFNQKLADEICVLYGGSANAGNAKDLMAQKDVDGLLVGGASLKVDDFVKIIQAAV
ncbi:MAG TPA: triose-phosphate isomerase [Sedimentisphaerales bacterium]|jgi:triosephosphate isomerase|nr:triose-phosphate isomerase [Sedimentisphaerales bacterium]HNU31230.1 triose-phosphate isomerase [Sedimentisphaerales bacterium]